MKKHVFFSVTFCALLLAQTALAQSNNYFAGSAAGGYNTTGSYNSFVGSAAGFYNTTGSYNSFLGSWAGVYNKTGNYNNFLGAYAGYSNTTGSYNSFTGFQAGYSNTIGYYNSFIGYKAGYYNTTGNSNSFIGTNAGYSNTTGSYNSILGADAGYYNTTGSSNAFVGYSAGYLNSTGNSNAFMGYAAGFRNSTGNFNTFVGNQSGYRNTTGFDNTMLGAASGVYNTTGKGNLFIGQRAGLGNTTGSGNSYVGYLTNSPSGVVLNNAAAIGNRAYVSRSNSLVLGSIAGLNGATSSVNVGIGTSAPAYKLQLSTNSAAKPGSSSWTVASDKRLKTNVEAFTDGLNVLLQVKPIKYRYNGKAEMPTDKEYVGIIAQEMKEIAPYTVGEFTYQDTTGKEEKYLDYDATALTYILVNSVKELKKENEALQQENVSLQTQLTALEQEVAQIKQLLTHLPGNAAEGNSAARLWQNAPNPYNRTTVIKYFVPSTAGSAAIQVFNTSGQQVGNYALNPVGEGELNLSASELAAGTYVYKLFVDGVSVDSKKLVLVR